jgi:hypothetical protein
MNEKEKCECGCGGPKHLLNNPPSRGCTAHQSETEFVVPDYAMKIVERPKPTHEKEAERKAIFEEMGKSFQDVVNGLPSTATVFEEVSLDKEEKNALEGKWKCNYHVKDVSTLTLQQANVFLHLCGNGGNDEKWYDFETPDVLSVTLNYPLSKDAVICIRPFKRIIHCKDKAMEHVRISPGYVLWMLAKAYKEIYERHEEFGIWGHGIGDLVFESLSVDKHGNLSVGIGS